MPERAAGVDGPRRQPADGQFFVWEDRGNPQTPAIKQLTLKMTIVALS